MCDFSFINIINQKNFLNIFNGHVLNLKRQTFFLKKLIAFFLLLAPKPVSFEIPVNFSSEEKSKIIGKKKPPKHLICYLFLYNPVETKNEAN